MENSSVMQSPQCQYFVVRKKRLCRMTVRPGRQYCGEHEPQPKIEDGQVDTRIPCPNDPKHTCYISKLQKHLAICNARQGELPPYIVKGINTATGPADSPRPLLSDVPQEMMEQLIEKVNMLYDKYVKEHIATVAEQPIHPMVVEDYSQGDRTDSSRRHLRQASSLLRLAEDQGLVNDRTCYVELGAGKGHMSYYAWKAWCEPTTRNSSVLLVDRASLRHKRDNKLRDLAYTSARDQAQEQENRVLTPTEREDNIKSKETKHLTNGDDKDMEDYTNSPNSNTAAPIRLRADLADLALDKVPVVQECDRVVGFAKHLCGVATDFALRCIMSDGLGEKTQGVVIATCCHHRCQTNTLVGIEYLYEIGLTAEELGVLYGVVSWATCGDGRSRDRRLMDTQEASADLGQDSALSRGYKLSQEARAACGRRAKALLDAARCAALRAAGLRARLVRYVPAAVSPENVALVATRVQG